MPKKNKADLQAAFNMEPKDAVAFFRAKGFQITDQWFEMETEAHAKAFTVAKAMRMDILEDIREATDAAISEGITEREFINRLAPVLKKKGWWGKDTWKDAQGNEREVQLGSVHRLKTIFRANTATAYSAGRYRRQLAGVERRPYWQYSAVMDSRTRPSHAALNARVFRWDDPIWQYIYPPNGWGCRCMVRAFSARDLERRSLTVEDGSDYIELVQREMGANVETGEVITTEHPVITLPDGRTMSPDLGWGHNPGASAFGTDAGIAEKLGRIASSQVRQQVIEDLNRSGLRRDRFAQWVDGLAENNTTGHSLAAVSLLTDEMAELVQARTGSAPGRLQAVDAAAVLARRRTPGAIQALDVWRQLPALIDRPRAILWDLERSALVYVTGPASAGKVNTVFAPYSAGGDGAPLNSLLDGRVISTADLINWARYELLKGSLEGLF